MHKETNKQLPYEKFQEENNNANQNIPYGVPIQQNVPLSDQQQQQLMSNFQYPPIGYQGQFAQQQIPQMNNQNIELTNIQPQQLQQQQAPSDIMPGFGIVPPQNNQFPNNVFYAIPKNPTSRYTQTLYCENCKKPIESQIQYKVGTGTLLTATLIFCFLPYGCCLAPCFIDDCKDSYHMCNECGTFIGNRKFLFN